jgi:hypothetical protein
MEPLKGLARKGRLTFIYLLYFHGWRDLHWVIAYNLGYTEKEFCRRAFLHKTRKNHFELRLLRMNGFRLTTSPEKRLYRPKGQTLTEAQELIEKVQKRMQITHRIIGLTQEVDLDSEATSYIRENLAKADFKAAYEIIKEAKEKDKAEDQEPDENQAREKQKEKTDDQRLRNEERKRRIIIDLEESIEDVDDEQLLEILLGYIEDLKSLDIDSRRFHILQHEIEDQVLRAEIYP